MPILGICRGSQMLNVALGGSLHQDAYARYGSRRYRTTLPRRRIAIRPDSRLAHVVGSKPMKVNALHRQAVDRLGSGLRVIGTYGRGMVQAIERVRDLFAIGVQWHPEHIFYAARHRALFTALIAATKAFRADEAQIEAVDGCDLAPAAAR